MDWKLGAPLRPSWATSNSLRSPGSYVRWQINGAFITMFNQFRYHCLWSPLTQYFLTLNTRMCNLDNQFQSYQIMPISSNRAGDVLRTIILKALLHRYIGLLLALHPRLHRPGYFYDTMHTWNRHLRYIILDLLDLA